MYTRRRQFQQNLETMDQQTRQPTIDAITALHNVEESLKTYEEGCKFLLDWFHNEIDLDLQH